MAESPRDYEGMIRKEIVLLMGERKLRYRNLKVAEMRQALMKDDERKKNEENEDGEGDSEDDDDNKDEDGNDEDGNKGHEEETEDEADEDGTSRDYEEVFFQGLRIIFRERGLQAYQGRQLPTAEMRQQLQDDDARRGTKDGVKDAYSAMNSGKLRAEIEKQGLKTSNNVNIMRQILRAAQVPKPGGDGGRRGRAPKVTREYGHLKREQLKEICRMRGMVRSRQNKAKLVKALEAYDRAHAKKPPPEEDPDQYLLDLRDDTKRPYQPGADSHRFLSRPFRKGRSANTGSQPWCLMAIVLLNDAINDHSEELGIDGWFLITSNGAVRLLVLPHEPWWYGPQAVFAMRTRSQQDRERWRQSTLSEKISLSSLAINAWQLDDKRAVHPIWMAWQPPRLEPGFTQNARFVPFAPITKFPRGGRDPTTVATPSFTGTPGIFIDLTDARFVCTSAEAVKKVALSCTKTPARIALKTHATYASMAMTKTWLEEWLPQNSVNADQEDGGDQIAALIKELARQMIASPEQTITFRRARAWVARSVSKLKPAPPVKLPTVRSRKRIVKKPISPSGTDGS